MLVMGMSCGRSGSRGSIMIESFFFYEMGSWNTIISRSLHQDLLNCPLNAHVLYYIITIHTVIRSTDLYWLRAGIYTCIGCTRQYCEPRRTRGHATAIKQKLLFGWLEILYVPQLFNWFAAEFFLTNLTNHIDRTHSARPGFFVHWSTVTLYVHAPIGGQWQYCSCQLTIRFMARHHLALALFSDYKPILDGNKRESHPNASIIFRLFGS